VTLERPLPRFVEVRRLARGSAAFYFRIPTHYRKLGCEMANEPLGTSYESACGDEGKGGRAATLNGLFDEWNDQRRGKPGEQGKIARYGTIDWLFRQYKTEKAYAKETMMRALAATRKRHAHLLAQKELDLQNADGAASAQDDMQQTNSMTKTSVGSQR
jgi:hypothetical protein